MSEYLVNKQDGSYIGQEVKLSYVIFLTFCLKITIFLLGKVCALYMFSLQKPPYVSASFTFSFIVCLLSKELCTEHSEMEQAIT
jgi:hypothetical protein